MKPFLVLLALSLPLAACKPSMPVSEACQVIDKTLRSNGGHFSLSPAEWAGLSDENQIKLLAVMKYYRAHCAALPLS